MPRVRLTIEPVPELGYRPCYVIRYGSQVIIGGPFDTPAAHIHRRQALDLSQALLAQTGTRGTSTRARARARGQAR